MKHRLFFLFWVSFWFYGATAHSTNGGELDDITGVLESFEAGAPLFNYNPIVNQAFEKYALALQAQRGFELVAKIKQRTDTLKIGFSQADINQDGKIILSKTGAYSPLHTNIIADVEITGTNVLVDLSGCSILGTVTVSGNAVMIKNGLIAPLPPTTVEAAAKAAITIHQNAQSIILKKCHVRCMDSITTSTTCSGGQEQCGIPGRSAVEVKGKGISFTSCSFGSGAGANTSVGKGGDGGHGIIVSGTAFRVRFVDCVILAAKGGASADGDGGSGGHGFHVKNTASVVEIDGCNIYSTGNGGNGTDNGGNGGTGIRIKSSAIDVAVHDCNIRNTGAGGTPNGEGGKAIFDEVETAGAVSIIYRNIAHNIANAIKFDIAAGGVETGVEMTAAGGVPVDGEAPTYYSNVYVS